MRRLLSSLGLLIVAGCTAPAPAPRPAVGPPVPRIAAQGLERVMGKDARALQALFGTPDLDVREGEARKLQYASAICVLDAYLYPPKAGRERLVTYVDARTPAGEDFDKASCVAALSRRREAR